jgi:hypothetical protein
VAAAISVVGSLALAVFTVVALRNVRTGGGAESETESRSRQEPAVGSTEVAPGV